MSTAEDDLAQLKFELETAKVNNTKLDMLVAGPDSANLGAIFGLFLTEVGRQFLENMGHYFMFPFAAAAMLLRAYFAWKDIQLNEGQNGTTRKFVLEVLSGFAITAAVVGSFFWSSISTLISPIIFAGVLGAKSLFHGVSAIYYTHKAYKANERANAIGDTGNPILKMAEQEETKRCAKFAKIHAVGCIAGLLATSAVVLVMIIAKPFLLTIGAVSGVVAGAIGALFAAVTYCGLKKPRPPGDIHEPLIRSNNPALRSDYKPSNPSPSKLMHKRIGGRKEVTDASVVILNKSTSVSVARHRNSFHANDTSVKDSCKTIKEREERRPVLAIL